MEDLMTIARRAVPRGLMDEVERSLRVPQYGPYHNEGPFMDSHLRLVLTGLWEAAAGSFHEDIPAVTQEVLKDAATTDAERAETYTLLHDKDKATCITLVRQDGLKLPVTWKQWVDACKHNPDGRLALMGDGNALKRVCGKMNLRRISYYQELVDGTMRKHGDVCAKDLSRRFQGVVPSVIIDAVRTHEVAYQFQDVKHGPNTRLFGKTFGNWKREHVDFALLVNYADNLGTLDIDGKPVLIHVLSLARAAHVYYGEAA